MAFKFNVDAGGNLVVDARKEAMQEVAATSGFGMSVDESGNLVTSSPTPEPSQMAVDGTYDQSKPPLPDTYGAGQPQQPYQTVIPSPSGPDTGLGGPERDITWAEIRDPFTGELRETAESRNLPETTPISAASYTKGINDVKSIAAMLLAADDEGRVTALKSLIPGLETQKDSGGNIIMTYPDGKQEVLNKPGFSEADAYQLAFDTALFLPGGIAAAPIKGAIKKGVVGAIGAGATEYLRQEGSKAAGTKEETSIPRIAMAAGTGALAEAVPAAIKNRAATKAQQRIGIAESQNELAGQLGKQAKYSDKLTEKTGIELGRAQKTRGISDAKRMNYVAQLPAAEQKAMKFLEKQNKQAYRAVNDLMDSIAPPETVGTASRRVRGAAQDIIKKSEAERAEAARPFYEKAFADNTKYSPDATIASIDAKLAKLPEGGTRATTLKKIKGFFKNTGGDGENTLNSLNPTGGIFVDYNPQNIVKAKLGKNITTLDKTMGGDPTDFITVYRGTESGKIVPGDFVTTNKQLAKDYAGSGKVATLKVKKGDVLDDITEELGEEYIYRPNTYKEINETKAGGLGIEQLDEVKHEIDGMIESAMTGGEKKLAGQLIDVKNTLLKEVDELNPDYAKAREIYSKRSPGIDELKESTIGQLAKKKDAQIKTVARELFEPDKNLFDPAAVKKARQLIEKQDPDAWNGIVRAEWQRRLGKARIDPTDLAANENVPGKLRSNIFGSGKERESLYSAMNMEQKRTARYLEEALKRAEKGRPGGSPTAANQVFEKELRGVGGTLRGLFSNTRSTIAELGADAKYDMRVKALADVMFDPKWKAKMSDLRKLSPTSAQSERMFTKILKQAIKAAVKSQSTPEKVGTGVETTRKVIDKLTKD